MVFKQPAGTITAGTAQEVMETLAAVERAVESGLYALGFITYEAAPGFDPAMVAGNRAVLPPVWFEQKVGPPPEFFQVPAT